VQADARAVADHGVWCGTVITALTVQNTRGVLGVEPVSAVMVRRQLTALLDDLDVGVIKLGMLATAAIVREVAAALRELPATVQVVCDPVLVSSSGAALLDPAAVRVLVEQVVPRCTLITPNQAEAAALAGPARHWRDWAEQVGVACLVTGGDAPGALVEDVLFEGGASRCWQGPRLGQGSVHGTGCTLSAAVAARLCRGEALVSAVDGAITYVRARIGSAVRPGGGAAVGGWAGADHVSAFKA
jgi:hydroxymethylpyrimidine/phosphomethylpyrimidine kinase